MKGSQFHLEKPEMARVVSLRIRSLVPPRITPRPLGLFTALALVIGLFSPDGTRGLWAQQDTPLLRVRRLLETGHIQEARTILRSLTEANPGDPISYRMLYDLLLRQKAWEEALSLVRNRKARIGEGLTETMDEARLLLRMGRQEEASRLTSTYLNAHPRTPGVVQSLAGFWIEERLFEEAIRIYLEGRRIEKKPDLYAMTLAGLYLGLGDYDRAAAEYRLYLESNPRQEAFVESQIRRFPKTPEGMRAVEAAFGSWNVPVAWRILFRYYADASAYEKALEVMARFTRGSPERRQALWILAGQALEAEAWGVAEKACRELLSAPANVSPPQEQVWSRLGDVYRGAGRFTEALHAYEAALSGNPERGLLQEILLKKGRLLLEEMEDPEAATRVFEAALRTDPGSWDALTSLGLAHIRAGRREKAEATYEALLTHDPMPPGAWIEARVGLAELRYWRGDFPAALAALADLAGPGLDLERLGQPRVNDGLALRLLITTHAKTDPEALRMLARADGDGAGRRWEAAITRLDSLLLRYPSRPIAAEALYRRAGIFERRGLLGKAVADLDTLSARFQGHPLAERALFEAGDLLMRAGNHQAALDRFERLLLRYPDGLWVDEARRRIRALEGGKA